MEQSEAKNVEIPQMTEKQLIEQRNRLLNQQKQMLKDRKSELKALKEDVDWMETNYKYMQLRMALPAMESKFHEYMEKEEQLRNANKTDAPIVVMSESQAEDAGTKVEDVKET